MIYAIIVNIKNLQLGTFNLIAFNYTLTKTFYFSIKYMGFRLKQFF